MTADHRISLKELDQFYRDKHSDIEFDEYMRLRDINWAELPYERKLAIYGAFMEIDRSCRRLAFDPVIDLSAYRKARPSAGPVIPRTHPARVYHSQSGVIHYFRTNQLNHESGDHRPEMRPREAAYRAIRACYCLLRWFNRVLHWLRLRHSSHDCLALREHLCLCKWNNRHQTAPDGDA